MKKRIRYLGLDVHAETIAAAIAEPGRSGEVRSLGTIANTPQGLRRLVEKLGGAGSLSACYEAGPTGYATYWELTKLGVDCMVVAPTLIPVKSGDRVKTDRRDAEKLARCLRSGDLTAVWVPDEEHEALRDLVRAREAAKKDQLRHRHRLSKLLLRRGLRRPEGPAAWSEAYMKWARELRVPQRCLQATLDHYLAEVERSGETIKRLDKLIGEAVEAAPAELRDVVAALQALRGVAFVTATTVAVEVGSFARFASARQIMAYAGIVPSEHSTGGPGQARRGRITKSGNAHIRRVIVEAAWNYRHRPAIGTRIRKAQQDLPQRVTDISWKAQQRLCARYRALLARGKDKGVVVTALARELLAFMWAIAKPIQERANGVVAQAPSRAAA